MKESSFKRARPQASASHLEGVRSGRTSVGLAALDDLLGGCLALGSVLLVLEDDLSSYARLVARYWLSQGLQFDRHRLLVFDAPSEEAGSASDILSSLMAPDVAPISTAPSRNHPGADRMKIAFRYAKLEQFKTTLGDCARAFL